MTLYDRQGDVCLDFSLKYNATELLEKVSYQILGDQCVLKQKLSLWKHLGKYSMEVLEVYALQFGRDDFSQENIKSNGHERMMLKSFRKTQNRINAFLPCKNVC